MNRFASVIAAVSLAASLAACGGGYSGFILPVESELNPWVAPEADEFIAEDVPAESDEDYEDYEDEEEGDEEPAPAAAPAAQ